MNLKEVSHKEGRVRDPLTRSKHTLYVVLYTQTPSLTHLVLYQKT